MTNIAEFVEKEYQNTIKGAEKLSRKKGVFKWAGIGTTIYVLGVSLSKLSPEFVGLDDYLANMDTLKYIESTLSFYPYFLMASLITGLVEPEVIKIASFVIYKPIKLVGRGVDYFSNILKSNNRL